MCFDVSQNYVKEKFAYSDYLVYKSSVYQDQKIFKPFYQDNFIYKVDVLQPTIELQPVYRSIDQGYHSYYEYTAALNHYCSIGIFLIPKGSRYFINEHATEIVSNRLMYLGEFTYEFNNKLLETYHNIKLETLKFSY